MTKRYDQYCPIAHALDLVGERWSLLIVRELIRGPLRYSDLYERLGGCSTNVLATRLKELESGGVVRKRRLAPPAASTVYELTEEGEGLRPVLHALTWWGVRKLGPPPAGTLASGWLEQALCMAIAPLTTDATIEFRVGEEVASLVGSEVVSGPALDPDAIVTTDAGGFYTLFVHGNYDHVAVEGDRSVVDALLARVPAVAKAAAPLAQRLTRGRQ